MRRVSATIRREIKCQAASEPMIGHLKPEHMERNHHKAREAGDRINAALATARSNFALRLR